MLKSITNLFKYKKPIPPDVARVRWLMYRAISASKKYKTKKRSTLIGLAMRDPQILKISLPLPEGKNSDEFYAEHKEMIKWVFIEAQRLDREFRQDTATNQ